MMFCHRAPPVPSQAALVYVAVNTNARRLSAAAAALTTHSRALLHSFGLEQRRTAQLDLISRHTLWPLITVH